MNANKKIKVYIVEDDPVQLQVLNDRFSINNPEYVVNSFPKGELLLKDLQKISHPKNSYVILDYFLQSNDNPEALNGNEVIELLHEQFPSINIILFSAYEGDEGKPFSLLKSEGKILDFIKKSEHAYSYLVNAIRLDHIKTEVHKKQRRLRFLGYLILLVLGAGVVFMAFLMKCKSYHL